MICGTSTATAGFCSGIAPQNTLDVQLKRDVCMYTITARPPVHRTSLTDFNCSTKG